MKRKLLLCGLILLLILSFVVICIASGVKASPGDANGDGTVNMKDALILRKHLAGWEVEADSTALDVNVDGTINMKDSLVLRKYLAGWDVVLGCVEHTPAAAVKENKIEGNCKTAAVYDEVIYCFVCNKELSRTKNTGEYGKHNFNGVECTVCHIQDPEAITEPTIVVNGVTASAGDTVEVTVDIINNPGVLGTMISLEFDNALTLLNTQNGEAFANLTYTSPSKLISGCNFIWFGNETGEIKDGAIIKLTFKVSDAAEHGDYRVTVKCSSEDTFNSNYQNTELAIINAVVSVE